MNRARTVSSSFALMVSLIAASAFAAGQAASPPPEWARPDNQRHARNGEAVYRCATEEHGPKARFDESSGQANLGLGITAGGRIPVYFHVIYLNSEGNVPESQLDAQIQVLNFNYAGLDYNGHAVSGAANTGYTFYKAGVTRTNNRKWFRMTPGTRAETQAKSSLAINPAGALNVYICKPGQNLLGWSVFPWWSQAGTKQDGVVIHYGSLPGAYLAPYNMGGTATHEIGHYLGLYHTFEGGCGTGSCSTSGDLVCDTPDEATASTGCPDGKDTCPSPGTDPIHNYMDYSTDVCYTNFTPGQDARMNAAVAQYRSWIGSVRIASGASVSTPEAAAAREDGLIALRAEPNPFNPRTKLEFGIPRAAHVSLRVFDLRGRLVRTVENGTLDQGNHAFDFDGDHLSSGIYFMELRVDGESPVVRRLSLLK